MSIVTKLSSSLVLIFSALVFTCCATLPSKNYQILQISQQTGNDQIDDAILNSLQRLGYRVEHSPGEPNLFTGLMKVPNDIWNRDYTLKVRKNAGVEGNQSLLVEADTCRGCVVTANDNFSPANRVKAFNGTFTHLLAQHVENESVTPSNTEPMQKFYNEFFGNKPSGLTQHPATEPPESFEKSPDETKIATEPSTEDDKKETRPEVVVDIETLAIEPSEVPANTTFDVAFTFKVVDRSSDGKEILVQTYYEIYLYEIKMFTSDVTNMEMPSGELIRRRESIQAGSKPGEYGLLVVVGYKDFKASRSAQFKIISANY
ncbi:MAG: hypothetical protein JW786_02200 [Desulfobacterales bacterium]|nr:hypothetical protein [Desulfobacterales bacterium]